ncbi:hypothetical protein ACOSP7_007194 [Xanthoceras sorbifolium]
MKIPRKDICGYNGIEDPDDHLDAYLDWMNMQGASDALKCKIFPLTLVGDARTWISGKKLGKQFKRSRRILLQQQQNEEPEDAKIITLDPRDTTSKPSGNPIEPLERVSLWEEEPHKVVLIGMALSTEVRSGLVSLLKQYSDVFAWSY